MQARYTAAELVERGIAPVKVWCQMLQHAGHQKVACAVLPPV